MCLVDVYKDVVEELYQQLQPRQKSCRRRKLFPRLYLMKAVRDWIEALEVGSEAYRGQGLACRQQPSPIPNGE